MKSAIDNKILTASKIYHQEVSDYVKYFNIIMSSENSATNFYDFVVGLHPIFINKLLIDQIFDQLPENVKETFGEFSESYFKNAKPTTFDSKLDKDILGNN